MTPTYSLGDCPECCPTCEYSIFIRIEKYNNGNKVAMVNLSDGQGGGFYSVAYPSQIQEPSGYFSGSLFNGANVDYSANSIVIEIPQNLGGPKTITFSNPTINDGTFQTGIYWEVSSDSCQEE